MQSNLSHSSKVIETAINEQLLKHLNENDIMPVNQSAYRVDHPTETTICAVMNDLIKIVDDGKCDILIMLDLSAAFDTVDHGLLLHDLKSIGIKGNALKWFESYLSNRYITVVISNEKSEMRRLNMGVPQGSVLGPILFNIYTTELSRILEKHNVEFKLYADDTQFYFSVTDTQDILNKVDRIMTDI